MADWASDHLKKFSSVSFDLFRFNEGRGRKKKEKKLKREGINRQKGDKRRKIGKNH